MKKFTIALLIASVAVGTGVAATFPTAAAKPLSAVLETLEQGGLKEVTDVDFDDDGYWEIEGVRNGVAVEIHVDPTSGKILQDEPDDRRAAPPAGSQTLSAIVKRLEADGYSIAEIELEGTTWEIESRRHGELERLQVDALTGALLSERRR